MEEKRKHVRKTLQPPVVYVTPDGERVEALCSDVSLGGAFVQTDRPLPFGAKFTLSLVLPSEQVSIDATVRWTKPGGMGVQFGLMGAVETHALVQLISG